MWLGFTKSWYHANLWSRVLAEICQDVDSYMQNSTQVNEPSAVGGNDDGDKFDTTACGASASISMSGARSAHSYYHRSGMEGGRPFAQDTVIRKSEVEVICLCGVGSWLKYVTDSCMQNSTQGDGPSAAGYSDDGDNFDTTASSRASVSIGMSGARSAYSYYDNSGMDGGRSVAQKTVIKKAELVVSSSKGVKHT